MAEPSTQADLEAGYRKGDGYWSRHNILHREGEYDSRGFAVLSRMQAEHFWYLGRRRFISRLLRHRVTDVERVGRQVIDLGAGCGGFVQYLAGSGLFPESRLAVGDSSPEALRFARELLLPGAGMYQIDLMSLGWKDRWDFVFLLDVLEHIPDDVGALREACRATRPGGYCLITVPALRQFWSWNDEVVGHQRRYSRKQLDERVAEAGLELIDSRYFMFLLSPLLAASRLFSSRNVERLNDREKWELVEKTHSIPARPINRAMQWIFDLETPLGHHVRFPWGTSLIALARKPG